MTGALPRRGFALLTVLWVIVGLSAVLLASGLAARASTDAAQNRVSLARARWAAEECAERVRAGVAAAFAAMPLDLAHSPWPVLDSVVSPVVIAAAPGAPGCAAELRPAGDALDVNAASGEQLVALFGALGVSEAAADSMADAVLDWRDADALPRARGAEGDWYAARGARRPKDAPLDDVRELADVRGVRALPDAVRGALDTLLTTEPGRATLDRTPLAVLATLPGMTQEALARLAERRLRRVRTPDVLALAADLSPAAQSALAARQVELASLLAPEPDAWLVRSRAPPAAGPGGSTRHSVERDQAWPAVAIELRLVRSGTRAAVVRHRTW